MQYKLLKKVQDEIFDPSQLDEYCLLVSIGTRGTQIAVVSLAKKRCLLLEDYALEGVRTQNDRQKLLQQLFSKHLFIRGGFWKGIKFSLKSHKFSLIPRTLYAKGSAMHFFSLNADINKRERLYAHPHKGLDTVNVFAADYKLVEWIYKLYPSRKISVTHQGSTIIEGALRLYRKESGKSMLFLVDKTVLHIVVLEKNRLYYYNQFAVQEVDELIRYVLLVFKELNMSVKTVPVTFYGNVPGNSIYVLKLRQHLKRLVLGKRPDFMQYPYPFDDIANHHYYDLLNTYLCQGYYPV